MRSIVEIKNKKGWIKEEMYKSKKGQSCWLTLLLTNPLNSDTKLQFWLTFQNNFFCLCITFELTCEAIAVGYIRQLKLW